MYNTVCTITMRLVVYGHKVNPGWFAIATGITNILLPGWPPNCCGVSQAGVCNGNK
jgi:hypothetical protein